MKSMSVNLKTSSICNGKKTEHNNNFTTIKNKKENLIELKNI